MKKFNSQYTCIAVIDERGHKQCISEFICDQIFDHVMANESFTPKMIQVEMLKIWGVEVSYDKAYHAKQKALAKLIGDWDESFAQIPSYVREL